MIPTFDQFLRPILALAAKGTITRPSIQPLLAEQFKLTEAEVSQRILNYPGEPKWLGDDVSHQGWAHRES